MFSSSPAPLIFYNTVIFSWSQGSVLSTHLLQTERSVGARFSGPNQIDPKPTQPTVECLVVLVPVATAAWAMQ